MKINTFWGMIKYYRDMLRQRSYILAPLRSFVSKRIEWQWMNAQHIAFEKAKQMVMYTAQLTYPDFNREFHVYANSSDLSARRHYHSR